MAKTTTFQGLTLPYQQVNRRYYTRSSRYCRWLLASILLFSQSLSANESCQSLSQLNWLQGNWQSKTDDKATLESWNAVNDDLFQGKSTSVKVATQSRYEEHLLIARMLEGIFYIAKVPENNMPIPFKAYFCGEDEVIFENLSHDFPQRLHYQLHDNTLMIRVEDKTGKGFSLSLERAE